MDILEKQVLSKLDLFSSTSNRYELGKRMRISLSENLDASMQINSSTPNNFDLGKIIDQIKLKHGISYVQPNQSNIHSIN